MDGWMHMNRQIGGWIDRQQNEHALTDGQRYGLIDMDRWILFSETIVLHLSDKESLTVKTCSRENCSRISVNKQSLTLHRDRMLTFGVLQR